VLLKKIKNSPLAFMDALIIVVRRQCPRRKQEAWKTPLVLTIHGGIYGIFTGVFP
jgi:hypothetical protein